MKKENKLPRLPRNYRPTMASNEMPRMRLIDLQRHCLIRGIAFEDLVNKTVLQMQSWLNKNWEVKTNPSLLDKFDQWREDYLKSKGMEDEPFIRLGYIASRDEETGEITKTLRPRKIKKNKIRREKDSKRGIYKGTKKALTYDCFDKGYSREKTVEVVIKAFPDAKDKSIKIWYKNAQNAVKSKKK